MSKPNSLLFLLIIETYLILLIIVLIVHVFNKIISFIIKCLEPLAQVGGLGGGYMYVPHMYAYKEINNHLYV
jgi:hypothetical protein